MSISDRLLENLFDSIYMICDIVKKLYHPCRSICIAVCLLAMYKIV